jgi:hypothetical protein
MALWACCFNSKPSFCFLRVFRAPGLIWYGRPALHIRPHSACLNSPRHQHLSAAHRSASSRAVERPPGLMQYCIECSAHGHNFTKERDMATEFSTTFQAACTELGCPATPDLLASLAHVSSNSSVSPTPSGRYSNTSCSSVSLRGKGSLRSQLAKIEIDDKVCLFHILIETQSRLVRNGPCKIGPSRL